MSKLKKYFVRSIVFLGIIMALCGGFLIHILMQDRLASKVAKEFVENALADQNIRYQLEIPEGVELDANANVDRDLTFGGYHFYYPVQPKGRLYVAVAAKRSYGIFVFFNLKKDFKVVEFSYVENDGEFEPKWVGDGYSQ